MILLNGLSVYHNSLEGFTQKSTMNSINEDYFVINLFSHFKIKIV